MTTSLKCGQPRPVNRPQCNTPGCGKQIPTRFMLCGQHWFQVPAEIREAAWDAWADWRTGQIGLRELWAIQARALVTVERGAA